MSGIHYYISWHTVGALYFRCFDSAIERDEFRKMIDCPSAGVQTWEAEWRNCV